MADGAGASYGVRMARTEFRTPRLYVEAPLAEGGELKLDAQQANYLVNVLRLGADAPVLLFNGRDGEFASRLSAQPAQERASAGRPADPAAGGAAGP